MQTRQHKHIKFSEKNGEKSIDQATALTCPPQCQHYQE